MTKQIINVGTTANDKKGDSLRAAFQKVNANFSELYVALGLNEGGLNLGSFEFSGSTMTTTDSSDIVLDQNVRITNELYVDGDIHSNGIAFGDSILTVDAGGAIYVNGALAATPGGLPTWSSITGKPTFATVATSGDYSDLSGKPTDISQFTDNTNLIGSTAVTISATQPASPTSGRLWFDTVSLRLYIYYDGSWVDTNPG